MILFLNTVVISLVADILSVDWILLVGHFSFLVVLMLMEDNDVRIHTKIQSIAFCVTSHFSVLMTRQIKHFIKTGVILIWETVARVFA